MYVHTSCHSAVYPYNGHNLPPFCPIGALYVAAQCLEPTTLRAEDDDQAMVLTAFIIPCLFLLFGFCLFTHSFGVQYHGCSCAVRPLSCYLNQEK